MDIYTLNEFINHYNPEYIQLLYGVHIINIARKCKGSYPLVRTFEKEKYQFRSFEKGNLVLEYAD